jgi:hypothetical protein
MLLSNFTMTELDDRETLSRTAFTGLVILTVWSFLSLFLGLIGYLDSLAFIDILALLMFVAGVAAILTGRRFAAAVVAVIAAIQVLFNIVMMWNLLQIAISSVPLVLAVLLIGLPYLKNPSIAKDLTKESAEFFTDIKAGSLKIRNPIDVWNSSEGKQTYDLGGQYMSSQGTTAGGNYSQPGPWNFGPDFHTPLYYVQSYAVGNNLVSAMQLQQMARAGTIQPTTLVQHKDATYPVPASTVPGIFSSKSYVTALLLSIFLGGLGIDRFYLGYTGLGVAKLLTLGGCGIWSLIDLILIAMRNVPDSNGNPLV